VKDIFLMQLSVGDVVSLIGLVQCCYVLVYMLFRSGHLVRGGLPAFYFLVLAAAFLMDFMHSYDLMLVEYSILVHWFVWFMAPPISVLVVLQVARITKVPHPGYFILLVFVPVAWIVSFIITRDVSGCDAFALCEDRKNWMVVSSCIAGALALLSLWFDRSALENIHAYKMGKERFWVILSLVVMNTALLFSMMMSLNPALDQQDIFLVRSLIGLGLAYIAGTGLFRIYPQAVRVNDPKDKAHIKDLNDDELEIAMKVERLMSFEKVYQEPGYSRSDLARECGVSELVISRVINQHFAKSYPNLVNELRVRDACQLLRETDAPAKTIAAEVGFNSLATFNRVFKDVINLSPSEYRHHQKH